MTGHFPYMLPTEEQQTWLQGQITKAGLVPVQAKVNPCLAVYGAGPAEAICKTCVHLVAHSCSKRTYYKCDLRKMTHGSKTDHLVRWPACSKYIPKP